MDAFSEILSGVKLNGAVFFTAEFSAPWGFSTPASRQMAEKVAPGAAHLVLYHLLIEGGAVIEMEDGESIALMPGDIVIFPHGDPHHMSSGKGTRPPFPNYGITAKIKARDLSPCAREAAAPSRGSCVVHDVRPSPESPDPRRPSVCLQGQRPDGSLRALARGFHPAPRRGIGVRTGWQRSHAGQAVGGAVRRYAAPPC